MEGKWLVEITRYGRQLLAVENKSLTRVQNPKDKSDGKRNLEYWIDLAKLLERGGINALFLADTYGG